MQDTQVITRDRIRYLVNAGRWQEIGILFEFTPVFHFVGRSFIDWRCVPQSLLDILQPTTLRESISAGITPPKSKRDKRPHQDRTGVVLFKAQAGICHYCHQLTIQVNWTIDHKLPYFRGGSNSAQNRVGACKACNGHKSCLTEEEFFSLEPGTRGIGERCKKLVLKVVRETKPTIISRVQSD